MNPYRKQTQLLLLLSHPFPPLFLLFVCPSISFAAHLTYIIPSSPVLSERGDFFHITNKAAGILKDFGHNINEGGAILKCFDDKSACSIANDAYRIVLNKGGGGDDGSALTDYAILTMSIFGNDAVAQSILCDLTFYLHKYLYGDDTNENPSESLSEAGFSNFNQFPVFSVVTANDNDLSAFLSLLSPKSMLERVDSNEVWTDDHNVRRAYSYGKLIHACTFQRDNESCNPSDADLMHAEAFVHPTLNSHTDPKRILFLGPNSYLSAREALKYNNVQEVLILESSKTLPQMVKKFMGDTYMPDILNSTRVTIEHIDPRLYVENISKEMTRMYEDKAESELLQDDQFMLATRAITFDLVFIRIPHAKKKGHSQYTDFTTNDFFTKLMDIIYYWNDDGIVVMNIGCEPGLDGIDRNELEKQRTEMLQMFMNDSKFYFKPILNYDEPRAAPNDTSFFVLFFNNAESHNFYTRQNAGAFTLDLAAKMTISDESSVPTRFYDGTTHKLYTRPSRMWEEWYCRIPELLTHKICTTIRPQFFDRKGNTEATVVVHHPDKGRSLHASESIPAGTFINLSDFGSSLFIDYADWGCFLNFTMEYSDATLYSKSRDMMIAYGYESYSNSRSGWITSVANVNTFTNHGCTEEERNVGGILQREDTKIVDFSPLLARHNELLHNGVISSRNIEKGEEILQNYLEFRDEEKDPEYSKFLSEVCETNTGLVPNENMDSRNDESAYNSMDVSS
eukprot:CAMPEP_0113317784 /NCGR_PEP_ID=MMETSP0010_2-20120614/12564_1 /TAXON_ID=216773 ORGANISM="Corethron hystrix, Strain 308" /NCGR_SAMPLE_ID=MMETSP0010_2 /ASSEMBLY_ACC=CAM_ASM_000155 /LENGTH=736 /DNA_ID=CAMNT_0000174855 /DNA_START=97 /DNA_END=2304 /DNA_ORIENTATION=- /assembly_acc=CAM_ASM_000155